MFLEHPPARPGFKLSAAWLIETFDRGRRLLFHAAWILRIFGCSVFFHHTVGRKVSADSIAVLQGLMEECADAWQLNLVLPVVWTGVDFGCEPLTVQLCLNFSRVNRTTIR